MIPLNVPRLPRVVRLILLTLCASLPALVITIPAQTENALPAFQLSGNMTKGYCYSDLNGATVYFSKIFEAVTKARTKISTLPLNAGFRNYLVEEYDFKSSANFPAQCSLFETLNKAEANKQQMMGQARHAGKQITEVNWNPSPITETPHGDESVIGPSRMPTHTVCAVGHDRTMYFSAVFELRAQWSIQRGTTGSSTSSARVLGLRRRSMPPATR